MGACYSPVALAAPRVSLAILLSSILVRPNRRVSDCLLCLNVLLALAGRDSSRVGD